MTHTWSSTDHRARHWRMFSLTRSPADAAPNLLTGASPPTSPSWRSCYGRCEGW